MGHVPSHVVRVGWRSGHVDWQNGPIKAWPFWPTRNFCCGQKYFESLEGKHCFRRQLKKIDWCFCLLSKSSSNPSDIQFKKNKRKIIGCYWQLICYWSRKVSWLVGKFEVVLTCIVSSNISDTYLPIFWSTM